MYKGSTEIVETLLNNDKSNPNIADRNRKGRTALIMDDYDYFHDIYEK